MGAFQDLTGQKFGFWTVIKRGHIDKKTTFWTCECECGTIKDVRAGDLKNGKSVSCGCYQRKFAKEVNLKHGKIKTRLYSIYSNIKSRCYNFNFPRYKDYGGRGIKLCNEWKDNFMNFYNWAINNGYNDELTIDRIDNDSNYEPSNCRWITKKEQNRNTRSNHLLTYKGETKCVADWAKEKNIGYQTLLKRINVYKWTVEQALERKVNYVN